MAIELIVIALQLVLILGYATLASLVFVILYLLEAFSLETFFTLIFLVLLLFLCWSTLTSGIALMVTFIKQGSSGLRKTKPIFWKMTAFGSALTIIGLIVTVISSPLSSPEQYYQTGPSLEFGILDFAGVFIFGLPLLIPYIHLLLEKKLRKEINT